MIATVLLHLLQAGTGRFAFDYSAMLSLEMWNGAHSHRDLKLVGELAEEKDKVFSVMKVTFALRNVSVDFFAD